MRDTRYTELARILVQDCVTVQPGEHVWIRAMSIESLPLAREVYKQVILAQAFPLYDIADNAVGNFFYKHANAAQLDNKPELMEFLANRSDKIITIVGEANKREMAETDPKKMIERSKLVRPVKDIMNQREWVLTYVPTSGMAQDANMSQDDFEDFYFGATNRDWSEIENNMRVCAEFLTEGKDIHIVGHRTDLHFSSVGRTWVYDDWKANMPGGEVFTSPVADSVEGKIYFNYPLLYQGKLIRDIEFTFERGRIIEANASENLETLEHILNTDSDSRRFGEIAFGGNPGIRRYMYSVLFDEKMAGTLHCAIGQGFAQCGGETHSAIHMDIVKDMTAPGSRVTVDGKDFLVNGEILPLKTLTQK